MILLIKNGGEGGFNTVSLSIDYIKIVLIESLLTHILPNMKIDP